MLTRQYDVKITQPTLQTFLDVSQQQFLRGQSRGQSRFLKESSRSCSSVPDQNPNWLLRLAKGRYQEN